jgi:homeobox protein ESX1
MLRMVPFAPKSQFLTSLNGAPPRRADSRGAGPLTGRSMSPVPTAEPEPVPPVPAVLLPPVPPLPPLPPVAAPPAPPFPPAPAVLLPPVPPLPAAPLPPAPAVLLPPVPPEPPLPAAALPPLPPLAAPPMPPRRLRRYSRYVCANLSQDAGAAAPARKRSSLLERSASAPSSSSSSRVAGPGSEMLPASHANSRALPINKPSFDFRIIYFLAGRARGHRTHASPQAHIAPRTRHSATSRLRCVCGPMRTSWTMTAGARPSWFRPRRGDTPAPSRLTQTEEPCLS